MLSIVEFAEYTREIATSRQPRPIAERFVEAVRERGTNAYIRAVLRRLERARAWNNQDLLAFEKGNEALRVGIKGKTVAWLAPIDWDVSLVPPAPVVSPLGMKRMALWIAQIVSEEQCPAGEQ